MSFKNSDQFYSLKKYQPYFNMLFTCITGSGNSYESSQDCDECGQRIGYKGKGTSRECNLCEVCTEKHRGEGIAAKYSLNSTENTEFTSHEEEDAMKSLTR